MSTAPTAGSAVQPVEPPGSLLAGLAPSARELLAELADRETRLLARTVGENVPVEISYEVEAIRVERAMLLGGLRAR